MLSLAWVMIMKPLKQKVSVTLDEIVVDTIKRFAEEDDRSFSQFINYVLKEYIRDKGNAGNAQPHIDKTQNDSDRL